MKEFEQLHKDKIEIHQEQNQQQEYKFLGKVHLTTGCRLFKYDPENDTMIEVIVQGKVIMNFDGTVQEERKAIHDPRFVYFQAINEKNARKKLKRYQAGEYGLAETFEEKIFAKLPY